MEGFPELYVDGAALMARSPVPGDRTAGFGGPYVVALVPDGGARSHILDAVNAARPPAKVPEQPHGWYAGLARNKLSVGPLPTFAAALDAARNEHGADKPIFVAEARPAAPHLDVFGLREVDRVLRWINEDNAHPFGPDAVLPPVRDFHRGDLAKRLNAAVASWMSEHGIAMISAALSDSRSMSIVLPDEVDRIETKPFKALVLGDAPSGWVEGSVDPAISQVQPDKLASFDKADGSPLSDMKSQVRVLGERVTMLVYRADSKMTRTGNCDDCGANYCHCLEDVRVKL